MQKMRTYKEADELDGKAYTFSATFSTGTLKLYAHFLVPSGRCWKHRAYRMHLIAVYNMDADRESFRRGAVAFNNLRRLAEKYRHQFIQDCNQKVPGDDNGLQPLMSMFTQPDTRNSLSIVGLGAGHLPGDGEAPKDKQEKADLNKHANELLDNLFQSSSCSDIGYNSILGRKKRWDEEEAGYYERVARSSFESFFETITYPALEDDNMSVIDGGDPAHDLLPATLLQTEQKPNPQKSLTDHYHNFSGLIQGIAKLSSDSIKRWGKEEKEKDVEKGAFDKKISSTFQRFVRGRN